MNILIINAGSSSLKYQLIDNATAEVSAKGLCERIGMQGSRLIHNSGGKQTIIEKELADHKAAIKLVTDTLLDKEIGCLKDISEINAVGHRVVHGGERFNSSVIINEEVIAAIDECSELAPIHNPPNLTGINACAALMPTTPQVAVFDTAFHQTMDETTYLYAIPLEFYRKYKVRKYGFHGTSHKYVALRAAELLNKPASELKLITIHLGNGSSVAAVKNGKSIDTSMGFTPLSGLVMGTRCGDIDPAIIAFLSEKENKTAGEITTLLNKKGGLLGVSELSNDFRDLMAAIDDGNKQAKLAIDMFVASIRKYIGIYAVAMGGVDAIIFTAGIGENNGVIRKEVTKNLEFMGIKIDESLNNNNDKEKDIATKDATVRVLVVPTNEELMIANETAALL